MSSMSAGQGLLGGAGFGAAIAAAACLGSCEVDLAASRSVAKRAVTGSIKSDFDNRTAHSYDGFGAIERKKCIDRWAHCSMYASGADVSVLRLLVWITARAALNRADCGNTAKVNKRGSSIRATCKGTHI